MPPERATVIKAIEQQIEMLADRRERARLRSGGQHEANQLQRDIEHFAFVLRWLRHLPQQQD